MKLLPVATSVDEVRRGARTAVLPVGSFEQHGGHLPLATDTIVACLIAQAIATTYPVLLLPPVTISCSHEHAAWPGTVSISAGTLIAVIGDIAASLRRSGVDKLVIVNGHGGNYVLSNVVQQANVGGPRIALFPGRQDWATAREVAGLTSTSTEDMHAGEIETSLLLHACPELVRDTYTDADHTAADRPHLLVHGVRGYTETGVIGRPSLATPEKGKAVLDSLVTGFAAHLDALNA